MKSQAVPWFYRILLTGIVFGGLHVTGISQEIPPLTITIYDSAATTGYYFMAPYAAVPPYIYKHPQLILDRYGNVIYFRFFPDFSINMTTTIDFKIQPNGMMSYYYYSLNRFLIMDSSFTMVDTLNSANGWDIDVHDLQLRPDGHYLLLAQETRIMNLTAYHWFGFNHNQPGSASAQVTGAVIQEFDETKTLVWEWKAHDHFNFGDVDPIWLFSPSKVDWTHANSVEWDNDGNILLCCRHFNEITKIDRQTGSIIWRWGGKANQFTFLNDPLGFNGQHDARRLPNGNITLFDNGRYHPTPVARALEYQLDETNKVATLVWDYSYGNGLYSMALGNVQTLPNGNRLVDFGSIPNNFPWMVLVKPDKSLVLKIECPNSYTSYRAFNYDTLPWELPRPNVDCIKIGDFWYFEAEAGYPVYFWSTGDTTQSILIQDTGTYWVFVPISQGYLSSERITVTDITNPCTPTGSDPSLVKEEYPVTVFPNPVNHSATIIYHISTAANVSLRLQDLSGKEVLTKEYGRQEPGEHTLRISLSGLAKGFYLLRIQAAGTTLLGKFILR